MTEKQAKKQLRKMLQSFTPGSVIHLLADLFGESAELARQDEDDRMFQQYKLVEQALIVMGMGVDAACPQ